MDTTHTGVRFETEGRTARITLDRPDRHNALEASDVAVFAAALDEIEGNRETRVLVVTGKGEKTFSSGASLRQIETGEMSGQVFDTLTDRLARLRVPTICALNGNAYGGGVELALCCDFRIGVRGMSLSVPAATLGLCYPIGGLTRYIERLGPTVTNRILLAAETLDAAELLRVGYLTECVEREDLSARADALAAHLAGLAPLAVQSMKKILLDIASGTVDPAEVEELVARCASSADLREGLAAQREGRRPDFEGH